MDKQAKMNQLEEKLINLKNSPLYQHRQQNNYQPVLGEGSLNANLMFIGEAPGEQEAKTGRPFVGAAGQFLNQLLANIDLQRKDVYITNVVKDRPPNNRDPKPEEIKLYSPLLIQQIKIIQPKIIATLGRFSLNFLLHYIFKNDKYYPVSQLHGKFWKTPTSFGELTIFALYHPAAALYNPNLKSLIQKDFQKLNRLLKKSSKI